MDFIDLHSHVLPGLDDGAPDEDVSAQLLRGLAELGFAEVCATPHQRADLFLPDLADIKSTYAATVDRLAAQGSSVKLHLGVENMWDEVFYQRAQAGAIPSYDDGPAFLVEFPITELPVAVLEHLFEVRLKGKLPVIAHPERYEALWGAPQLAEKLANSCAMVVDLGAVGGHHGRKRNKAARDLLKNGFAHAAASDVHMIDDIRAAADGIKWIEKKLGPEAVRQFLVDSPRLILQGEHPG
jgi:protein-tyrosine phosphatase